MFTGIVQTLGKVLTTQPIKEGLKLEIEVPISFNKKLKRGASVSVNGVCLTVVEHYKERIIFDVIHETLRTTNLSDLDQISEVNIERSLKFGDEMGGHILSGHVCCECEATLKKDETEMKIVVNKPKIWGKYILSKGYVALNGISLTVGKVTENEFSVYLIPETIESTNLLSIEDGATLNLEVDQNSLSQYEKKRTKKTWR